MNTSVWEVLSMGIGVKYILPKHISSKTRLEVDLATIDAASQVVLDLKSQIIKTERDQESLQTNMNPV